MSGRSVGDWGPGRKAALLLFLITLVGVVLRLIRYGEPVTGDELSTLWIVTNNGLGGTVELVRGDAEITPPLSFILSWFAVQLGSAPELIRLPSLLAGIAAIPLTCLLGVKTVGLRAGLVGAAVMALSPYLTYFSANGRGYTVLILLLLGSTLTMLKADETGRVRWWVAYAVLSCLAMYSHYTAVFILLAQFLWLFFLRTESRKASVIACAGAALFYLPWIPGLRADLDSPSQPILEALQGDGFGAKRDAVIQWVIGRDYLAPADVPGKLVLVVVSVTLVVALAMAVRKVWLDRNDGQEKVGRSLPIAPGLLLVLMIALAAPVCELLLQLAGTDIFGSRNVAASWYGLALAMGAVLTLPGGAVTAVAVTLVLGGYGVASVTALGEDKEVVDFRAAASQIEEEAEPGDVVVDMYGVLATPVPLTPLAAYLDPDLERFEIGLPKSPPPNIPGQTDVTPAQQELREAFREAEGGKVHLLTIPRITTIDDGEESGRSVKQVTVEGQSVLLPESATVTEVEELPGFLPARLYTIEVSRPGRQVLK
ncbi:MAG: glycosyltransferase family 39 protein [Solirubrobacterales bacterium]